jgi:hypothetical protein
MPGIEERYETPKWRMLWLVISFTILVGIGVVTVLLPELEDEPDEAQSFEIEQPSTDKAASE